MKKLQRFVMILIIASMALFVGAQMAIAQDTPSDTDVKQEEQATEKVADTPQSTDQPTQRQMRRPSTDRRRPDSDRGERRQFDPSRMMDRMLERYKEGLKPKDEEWKVIEPLLKKVLEARMDTRMFGFGRRGGESASANTEADALRTALESEKSTTDEIKAKLAAYRESQKKKEESLQKAREDLRKVLTVKQEAELVLTGVLD